MNQTSSHIRRFFNGKLRVFVFFYYRTTSYDVTDRRNIVHRMLGKILTSFERRFVLFSCNIDLKIRTNSIWRY